MLCKIGPLTPQGIIITFWLLTFILGTGNSAEIYAVKIETVKWWFLHTAKYVPFNKANEM